MKTVFKGSLLLIAMPLMLMSCVSTGKTGANKAEDETKAVTRDANAGSAKKEAKESTVVTEIPVFKYKAPGLKIEAEAMKAENAAVVEDSDASKGKAVRIETKNAVVQAKVFLPAGDYECLVSEKAFKNANAVFFVGIDGTFYKMYPSNPPLGIWELTTRTPAYFTMESDGEILVTMQASAPSEAGSTGMTLDYIQFVRR